MSKFKRLIRGMKGRIEEVLEVGTPEEANPVEFAEFEARMSTINPAFNTEWQSYSSEEKWELYNAWKEQRGKEEEKKPEWQKEFGVSSPTEAEQVAQAEERRARAEYLHSLMSESRRSLAKEFLQGLGRGLAASGGIVLSRGSVRQAAARIAGTPQPSLYTPAPRSRFGPPSEVYRTGAIAGKMLGPSAPMPRAAIAHTISAARAGQALLPMSMAAAEALREPATMAGAAAMPRTPARAVVEKPRLDIENARKIVDLSPLQSVQRSSLPRLRVTVTRRNGSNLYNKMLAKVRRETRVNFK